MLLFFSDSRDEFPPKLSWSIFNVLPFFTNVLKSMAFWNLLWQNDVAVQINVCPCLNASLFCVAAWFQDGGKQRLPSYLSPTNCSLFSIYVYKLCTNHFPSITILQLFLMISSSSLNTNSSSFSGNPSSNHLGAQF